MRARADAYRPYHRELLPLIQQYLAARGAWQLKVWGNVMMRPGVPDILACLEGRLIAVEVKSDRAPRLSEQQQEERRGLEHAGAVYVVARSVDDVEAALLAAGLVAAPALAGRS